MKSLLAWARAKGLLYGGRNAVIDDAILDLRHAGAHPHSMYRVDAVYSARAIRDVAEIINHLWGKDTPGGRLYPTPLEMAVFAVQRESDGSRGVMAAEGLETVALSESGGQWFIVEAATRDYESMALLSWNPHFEATAYPTTKVWGPGTWRDAVAAWKQYRHSRRTPVSPEWRNRVFLVRARDGVFERCRSPEQFAQLSPEERDRPEWCWWIVRADHPGDVHWYMQEQVTATSNPNERKRKSAVEKIAVCETWQRAVEALAEAGITGV